ncbi:hypothetical protein CHS0354_023672 [Potamilus streckersoni]|uniref:C2H2-type domain-containing protein n=1 Tax=Potamilus streckersoni TaxID=2493646 RepID=A0AAE0VSV9_9BIVA|nr:hypothetical protein CHS0354_023672 [Potamilus streckersoni]
MNVSNMLTSSASQYLHPDYLQPLPTTLDAKKSPLAMLAQTCSSIGKDSPNSKSIIPPIEKKDTEKSNDKSTPKESNKSPSKENSESERDSMDKSGSRSVPPKDIPPLVPISSSGSDKPSPVPGSVKTVKNSENTAVTSSVSRPMSSAGPNSGSNGGRTTSAGLKDSDSHKDVSTSASRISSHSTPESSKPHSNPSHSSFYGLGSSSLSHHGLPYIGHGLHLDPTVSSAYASSLAAHTGLNLSSSAAAALAAQNAALKPGLSAGLSPYVSYARVRTPSGATTLVPVCRDPYCTNCQLSLQNCHISSTCTSPGCAQCAHEKSLQSLSALGLAGSSLPLLPQFSVSNGFSSATPGLSSLHALPSSLYAHNLLGSHQGLPYVCNWVSGSDYCGKRFTSSEDLLQHLRTHTSSIDASLSGYSALGLPHLGLSGYAGHLVSAGGLSPNSLRRAYPTIPSPLSSSILGSSRYHPYKTPLASASSGLQPGQPLSSLGPYYSPYSMYSQRLGAAAVP